MINQSSADIKSDYEKYVNRATMLIHSPETTSSVQKMLTGDDPVQRIAKVTVMIMQRIDAASRTAKQEVHDTIKVLAAVEVVNIIVELGQAAKLFKVGKKLTELAVSVAVQDYIKSEAAERRIMPQKLKAQMDVEIRKMPPKEQQDIRKSMQRVQQTAREYNHGKGTVTDDKPVKTGIIGQGGK